MGGVQFTTSTSMSYTPSSTMTCCRSKSKSLARPPRLAGPTATLGDGNTYDEGVG